MLGVVQVKVVLLVLMVAVTVAAELPLVVLMQFLEPQVVAEWLLPIIASPNPNYNIFVTIYLLNITGK
jgi:hypothetical protein